MNKIGIFYGSTTGNTAEVANKIASSMGLNGAAVHDVKNTAPSVVGDYDVLLFGASTWGDGDMQADMADFLDGVAAMNLADKKIALFGCGDETMRDTFGNAVGEMYRKLQPTQATMIGDFNTQGYSYNHSDADIDGRVVGLIIDNVNHQHLEDSKIEDWTSVIKSSLDS